MTLLTTVKNVIITKLRSVWQNVKSCGHNSNQLYGKYYIKILTYIALPLKPYSTFNVFNAWLKKNKTKKIFILQYLDSQAIKTI